MGPWRVTIAAKAASPAGSRRAMNRSRSWRSVIPATEPPSKSDSICRKTDPVAAYAMPSGSLADTSVPTHSPRPNTVLPPLILSQVVLGNLE